MDQNLKHFDSNVYNDETKTHMRVTKTSQRKNNCNQCGFASDLADNLRRHLKTHSGEKSEKCSQFDYACSQACDFRRHLVTHSGEETKQMQLM